MSPRLILCLSALVAFTPAQAYLGGFEDQDGYTNDYNTGSGPFGNGASAYNVFYYNAGSYGTNNGGPGGGPLDIPNNTGSWRQLDGTPAIGNRYAIAHAQVGAAHSFEGDSMLGMRNDTSGASDLIARYFLDARDLNGTTPGSSLAEIVHWSLRVCPDPIQSGVTGSPIFNWTFRDANLDAGLELGWDHTNTVIYKLPGQTSWTATSFALDRNNYDRLELHLDTTGKTWWLDAFDVSANQTVNVVNSAALDASLDAVTAIDWTLKPNQTKTYFDNSMFSAVPEPSSALLSALAVAFTLTTRRRPQPAMKKPSPPRG